MARNIEKLVILIQNSASLSPRDKIRLIQSLEALSDEDLQKLEETLTYEKSRVQQIHEDRDKQVEALNSEYEGVVKDFKFKQVPKIRAKVEKKQHQQDEDAADQMINSI